MNIVYQTKATAVGGRNGKVTSEDGVLEHEVRIPKSMGGSGGEFTNPEQLFAAGYAACFDNALIYVAMLEKTKIKAQTEATVCLDSSETEGFNLMVNLDITVDGVDKEKAQDLVNKAHATCPYSKAIKNNVEVSVNLV